MGVGSLLPLCSSWGSNSSYRVGVKFLFPMSHSLECSLLWVVASVNIWHYLGAQAKSRVHTRASGNTRTELHPIRCVPHMHCYGTTECVHNLNNTRKGLLCILRVHTKAMTFLSILEGRPYWKKAFCVQEISEKGRLLRSGVFCPFYFPSNK